MDRSNKNTQPEVFFLFYSNIIDHVYSLLVYGIQVNKTFEDKLTTAPEEVSAGGDVYQLEIWVRIPEGDSRNQVRVLMSAPTCLLLNIYI